MVTPASNPPVRWFRVDHLAYAMPVLLFAAINLLIPADQIRLPREATGKRYQAGLLFDRGDLTCYALRGLNAQVGRRAGLDDPRTGLPRPAYRIPEADFLAQLDSPPPLRDRYFLDYPHPILYLFQLGWVLQGRDAVHLASPAILDGAHNNIDDHIPRNAGERELWSAFVRVIRFYLVVFLLFTLGMMVLLDVGYGADGLRASPWRLVLPGAMYFCLSRFDVIPALLVGLSLACLGRKRPLVSAFFLAAATVIKVYPCLLAPLMARYLWPQRRPAVLWCLVYGLTLCLGLIPLLLGEDVPSLLAAYRFQILRELDPEFTFYGWVVPESLAIGAAGKLFRFGSLLLVTAALLWTPIPDLVSLLRRGSIFLLYFLSTAGYYSPQWILWLTPLLLPLAPRLRGLMWLILGLDLVSYGVFPGYFALKGAFNQGIVSTDRAGAYLQLAEGVLVYSRFVVTLLLFAVLLVGRARPASEAPALASGGVGA
jgi:hypothetical protein